MGTKGWKAKQKDAKESNQVDRNNRNNVVKVLSIPGRLKRKTRSAFTNSHFKCQRSILKIPFAVFNVSKNEHDDLKVTTDTRADIIV